MSQTNQSASILAEYREVIRANGLLKMKYDHAKRLAEEAFTEYSASDERLFSLKEALQVALASEVK